MNSSDLKHTEITGRIIQEFYQTYNRIGFGFDLKVYKKSFSLVLRNCGLKIDFDKEVDIIFEVEKVGSYLIDFVVEQKVIVLISASNEIQDHELKRLYNFLRWSQYETGLLLNFGIKPEHKRRDII